MSDSSDPMDCSLPGSSIHGTFQARVLEWGAIAFSGGIVRDNEINSLHPISDDLITGLLFQGILGEVLHAELVPFSPTPIHQLSATYACSVLFSPTW